MEAHHLILPQKTCSTRTKREIPGKPPPLVLTRQTYPTFSSSRIRGVAVGNDANNNFPVLRYADALLNLAEALGETTESYSLINEVRHRANLGTISSATPGTFTDKLMHERQVEFAFECQRWHDLLRMGKDKAISIMNGNLSREFPGGNISIDEHDLLAPIPFTETQVNTLATQNPGYVE